MKRLINLGFLVLLFSAAGCVFEDEQSINADEIFIKYYGTSKEERAVDLVELKRSGGSEYLILGTRQNDVNDIDYLLIKTDSLGVRLWERTYRAKETFSLDIPNALTLYDCTNDMDCNKVIIAGTSSVGNESHAYIVAVDLASDGVVYGDLNYQYFASDHSESARFVNTTCNKIIPYNDNAGLGFISVGSVAEFNDRGTSVLVSRFESSAISQDLSVGFLSKEVDVEILSDELRSNSDEAGFARDSIFNYESTTIYQGDEDGVDVIMVKSNPSMSDKEAAFYYLANFSGVDGNKITIGAFEGENASIDDFNPMEFAVEGNHFGSELMYDGAAKLRVVGTTINGASQNAFEVNVGLNLKGQDYNKYTFSIDNSGSSADENWKTSGEDLVRSKYGKMFVLGQVLDYKEGANQILKGSEIVLMSADAESNINEDAVQVMGGIGDDDGKAMIIREDGSIVIAATTDFGGSAFMITLVKTNSRGELLKE